MVRNAPAHRAAPAPGPGGSRRGHRHTWPWVGAAVALALGAGCPAAPGPVKLLPTLIAPPFQAVALGSVQQQGTAISGGSLQLKVLDANTHRRVSGALVSVLGPTLGTGVSGSTYDLLFSPLASASYRLRISAPGYVVGTASGIAVSKEATTSVEADLAPSGAPVTGRILDFKGQPIAGARVLSGVAVTFSSADGTFSLDGLAVGTHPLTIAKTGYQTLTGIVAGAGQSIGDRTLTPAPVVVDVANAATVFGTQSAASTLSGLTSALQAAGCQVQEDDASGATVMLFAGPGPDVASQASVVQNFVSSGGKVVVLGEWGGAGGGYSPGAVNSLLQPLGLAIETDLVRNDQNLGKLGWILASPDLPFAGVSQVAVFDSASVFKVAPAIDVLSAGVSAMRVADVDPNGPILGALMPYETGLAMLLGDTSAFSDSTTLGQGTDLTQKDNQSFIVQAILW